MHLRIIQLIVHAANYNSKNEINQISEKKCKGIKYQFSEKRAERHDENCCWIVGGGRER